MERLGREYLGQGHYQCLVGEPIHHGKSFTLRGWGGAAKNMIQKEGVFPARKRESRGDLGYLSIARLEGLGIFKETKIRSERYPMMLAFWD